MDKIDQNYIWHGVCLTILILFVYLIYVEATNNNNTQTLPLIVQSTNREIVTALKNVTANDTSALRYNAIGINNAAMQNPFKFDLTNCAVNGIDISDKALWIWDRTSTDTYINSQLFATPLHFRATFLAPANGTLSLYVIANKFVQVRIDNVIQCIDGSSTTMNLTKFDENSYDICADYDTLALAPNPISPLLYNIKMPTPSEVAAAQAQVAAEMAKTIMINAKSDLNIITYASNNSTPIATNTNFKTDINMSDGSSTNDTRIIVASSIFMRLPMHSDSTIYYDQDTITQAQTKVNTATQTYNDAALKAQLAHNLVIVEKAVDTQINDAITKYGPAPPKIAINTTALHTIDFYCVNGDGINFTTDIMQTAGICAWCTNTDANNVQTLSFYTEQLSWTVQPVTLPTYHMSLLSTPYQQFAGYQSFATTTGIKPEIIWNTPNILVNNSIALSLIRQSTQLATTPLKFEYIYISSKNMPNAYLNFGTDGQLCMVTNNDMQIFPISVVPNNVQINRIDPTLFYNSNTARCNLPLVVGINRINIYCANNGAYTPKAAGLIAWCTPNIASTTILFATDYNTWTVDRLSKISMFSTN